MNGIGVITITLIMLDWVFLSTSYAVCVWCMIYTYHVLNVQFYSTIVNEKIMECNNIIDNIIWNMNEYQTVKAKTKANIY